MLAQAPGVLVGDLLWASTNSIANPGGTATFADTPYRYDFKSGGVRNYQYTWNAITGGTSGNTAPGYCPDGWRLPTKDEYVALNNASTYLWVTSYTDPADGSVVNGGEFTNKVTGEKLFFPASGRDSGGWLGTDGLYWSSTQNSSNSSNGYLLVFLSGNVRPSGSNNKTNTLSVRCVRPQ